MSLGGKTYSKNLTISFSPTLKGVKWSKARTLLSDPTLQGRGKDREKCVSNNSIMGFSATLEVHYMVRDYWTPSGAEVPNKKDRLPAFTLVDILAGMVIMSIVVGMVFGVFNMVNSQTQDFQNLRIELNEFVLMQADLQRQIDACENIYQVPSGFVLELKDEELKYFISENALMRQSEDSRVTLHPSVSKIEFEFEKGVTDQPLITSIEIITKLRDMELKAHFSKDYSNADRINHLLLNEH